MDRNLWVRLLPLSVVLPVILLIVLSLAGCTSLFPSNQPQPSATNIDLTREPTATEMIERSVASPTPQPSSNSSATVTLPTVTASEPPSTKTPTPIPTEVYAYHLQEGSPAYLPNLFRTNEGCSWTGAAGQIFDERGQPVSGVVVEVDGKLNEQSYLQLGISGGAPQYGQGGYEITLGGQPFSSQDALTIVLFDLDGNQLSDYYPLITSESCTQNLIIMNFLSSDYFETRYYLPVMSNGGP